jgi:hypothetical protein
LLLLARILVQTEEYGMAEDNKNSPPPPDEKKPYSKPTVVSEPIYETLALACGKLPGQGGICNAAPRRS